MLRALLHFLLLDPVLQIVSQILFPAGSRHNPRRVGENLVHLLKRHLLGFREQKPEENRIGKVSNDKHEVEPIPNNRHRNRGDLTNHRVEGE